MVSSQVLTIKWTRSIAHLKVMQKTGTVENLKEKILELSSMEWNKLTFLSCTERNDTEGLKNED